MNPTIFITGANRGLGLEFAKQYSQMNWNVIATCRHPESAEELQYLKTQSNKNDFHIYALEVTDEIELKNLANELKDVSIDILLNNAAIFIENDNLGNFNNHQWRESFNINVIAPMMITQAFANHVLKSNKKIFAYLSSGYGSIAENNNISNCYAYRASKSALNMCMKSFSLELQNKNAVSICVSPGWVKTDMGGANAEITAEESVTDLRHLFDKLSIKDSGKFYTRKGVEIPW